MKKNLKQKILWHCPFKAKHQRTQECTDVTSQNFIKILSLETIPLKSKVNEFLKRNTVYKKLYFNIEFSQNYHPFQEYFHRNNSIYKITSPSYGVKEEICRRMPRNFYSSTQFQRKWKSLVFFQSINFLCCRQYCRLAHFQLFGLSKQPNTRDYTKYQLAHMLQNQYMFTLLHYS